MSDELLNAMQEAFPSEGVSTAEVPHGVESLVSVSSSIQEDVVILSGDPQTEHAILAGVVCFPSGWSIAEKIGKSIDATHEPVPEYQAVFADATNRLLSRLKAHRPVWRMNWGVRCSGQLDQSPKHASFLEAQLARRTMQNRRQLLGIVELEVVAMSKSVAHSPAEQSGPGRRPDQRETTQGEVYHPAAQPALDREIHPKVLHGRI